MKVYKNNVGIKIFSHIFVIIFIILLIINIIDAVKYSDFKNIKYYILMLIPFIYIIIFFSINYYRKIYITEKSIYLKKIIFKKEICYHEILEIKKPNIITLKKIIKIDIEDEYFWKEIKENYLKYCTHNMEYFNETKEIYENLLEIKHELNKEEIQRDMKIRVRWSIFVVVFIWLMHLKNYIAEKELYKEYTETEKLLRKYIEKYKSKPNFA
jgi:hypothetical protein